MLDLWYAAHWQMATVQKNKMIYSVPLVWPRVQLVAVANCDRDCGGALPAGFSSVWRKELFG